MNSAGRDSPGVREPLLGRLRKTLSREGSLGDTTGPEYSRLVSYKPLLGMSSGVLLTFFVIGVVSIGILVSFPFRGDPPLCRKSAALAVLPPAAGSNKSLELLVWSGMGRHQIVLDDLRGYDVGARQWRTLETGSGGSGSEASFWHRPAPKPPQPLPRWKAGVVQVPEGMVVFGGDAFMSQTKHKYQADLWLLELQPSLEAAYTSLEWKQAGVDPAAPPKALPSARRAHTTIQYKDEAGVDRVVVFGGREQGSKAPDLNDSWEATLSPGPNVTWRLIEPMAQQGLGDEIGKKALVAPLPPARKGHVAVLVDDAESPQMLVHGGRDTVGYLGDLWLLDIPTGQWSQVQPAGTLAPLPRDHHSAAYFRGKFFIYGGRAGPTYDTSRPLDDLWAFDLHTLLWRQVPQPGAAPLPRFLHSFVQYSPPGSQDSRLLIFGGETLSDCKLNDVWELSLTSTMWSQLSPPMFCNRKCWKTFRG